ncbi:hypothetical protein [Aurantimonas sp. VKM B-3413]|uniref:hypothetical protein n=1 Tax=Aurantimonas sp. VKM B-3413 TaxID=2779401 RepID=UPI001E598632|nr:hypothetical protein [Aurantimonas sp. VKM B-3413]MCB8839869.1 hypothetical protein [Aurantimonas sp. VKM B-3413]
MTTPDPADGLKARLRRIEDEIEQARERVTMAQGSDMDSVIADEIETLQAERDRLLAELREADDTDMNTR